MAKIIYIYIYIYIYTLTIHDVCRFSHRMHLKFVGVNGVFITLLNGVHVLSNTPWHLVTLSYQTLLSMTWYWVNTGALRWGPSLVNRANKSACFSADVFAHSHGGIVGVLRVHRSSVLSPNPQRSPDNFQMTSSTIKKMCQTVNLRDAKTKEKQDKMRQAVTIDKVSHKTKRQMMHCCDD